MQKIIVNLLYAVGGIAVVLSLLLFLNRTDTQDAKQASSTAKFEVQSIEFDEDFARFSGVPIPPDRAASMAERKETLNKQIQDEEKEIAEAKAKRKDISKSLDNVISDIESGNLNISPGSNAPGPLSVLLAGLILFGVGLALRATSREKSSADDGEAKAPIRFADKAIDWVRAKLATPKKEG